MEVIVYLALGLAIWVLVPSERSALVGRVAERSVQAEQRRDLSDEADEASTDLAAERRDLRPRAR
jgi:hypothetical protein